MPDAESPLMDIFRAKWFWVSAGVLAALVVGLAVAYYAQHPERNIFEDFARRAPIDIPSTNGRVPHAASTVGADSYEGEETG
jgi:hypothetical protein